MSSIIAAVSAPSTSSTASAMSRSSSSSSDVDKKGIQTDRPRLSLSVESPPSSSPFPSPSSSFLPPPMPGAHEFASWPPNSQRYGRKKSLRPGDEATVAGEKLARNKSPAEQQPSSSPTKLRPQSEQQHQALPLKTEVESPADLQAHFDSRTPTNSNTDLTMAADPKRTSSISASIPPSSFTTRSRPTSQQSPLIPASPTSPSARSSLTSSRPAPASPAVSRAASLRRAGSSLSRTPSTLSARHQHVLSNSTTLPVPRSPAPIKIRDFAFPPSDARHIGMGPDAPRRISIASTSGSSDAGSRRNSNNGWGGFRWSNLAAGKFAWGFGGSKFGAQEDGGPTHSDFARNFDVGSPPSSERDDPYDEDYEAEGEEGEGEVGGEYDGPLLPGLYRALYTFEPEGTAEMALEEDQEVRVIGRGGGVGWAIAIREGGGHALVPESYLEVVRLDGEEVEDEGGQGQAE